MKRPGEYMMIAGSFHTMFVFGHRAVARSPIRRSRDHIGRGRLSTADFAAAFTESVGTYRSHLRMEVVMTIEAGQSGEERRLCTAQCFWLRL